MDLGPRRWTGSPPVTRRGYGAAPGRCLQAAADPPCEMASESIADALQYLDDTIHRVYAAGRRSCAQGRWSVARAPVTWWTDCGRGPQTDAGERIISAHRAIEIREKRRWGPLVMSCLDYLALRSGVERERRPPLRLARPTDHAPCLGINGLGATAWRSTLQLCSSGLVAFA